MGREELLAAKRVALSLPAHHGRAVARCSTALTMEGPMDRPISRRYREANYHILDYGREPDFAFDQTPDAVTYWFLAAVLCAFIAAGLIVYRTSTVPPTTTQTAAVSTGHPAAQADPIAPTNVLSR
jgi:hypothetical protein